MTQSDGGSSIDSLIELYDSDIKAITDGPIAWHESRMKSRRDIDDHAKGLEEQFHKIGLEVEVQCWLRSDDGEGTSFSGPVKFEIEIQRRINPESGFDYDRMKHEIRNNLLEIPGEGGTIKFDEKEFLRKHGGKLLDGHKGHGH